MKKGIGCLVALGAFIGLLVIAGAFYTVPETEQVIITQFGEPMGEPVITAGLKFKIPFIQEVNRIEKRILEWDGRAEEMPTKDKTYIKVDTFGRWQIKDPLMYFQKLRDERSALSRLDDILGSETRNAIAKHELIEVIRTTKDRVPAQADELLPAGKDGEVSDVLAKVVVTKFEPIRSGRAVLAEEIFAKSKEKLAAFGIDLLDVRFKRINYNPSVQEQIYERMISERQQIAEKFRSEGAGKAAAKLGEMERDLKEISSTAYKEVETVKGEADAKATEIYANAYDQSPEAAALYEFVKTMDLYKQIIGQDSTLILSTDSDIFRYLKRMEGKEDAPGGNKVAPKIAPPASAPPATPAAPPKVAPPASVTPPATPAAPPKPNTP